MLEESDAVHLTVTVLAEVATSPLLTVVGEMLTSETDGGFLSVSGP